MDTSKLTQSLIEHGTQIGLQVLGALLLWFVGRWLIRVTVKLANNGMARQKMDSTLANYTTSTINGLLNVVLVISILGEFGVQTTTFAALFAAIGLAIGAAWSGLLANFAAGVFMIILRPFKVGDYVVAGGIEGTVIEIGPFGTKLTTPDNILTIVGNNKVLSDDNRNFSAHPYRRVELSMQLNHDANYKTAAALLKARLVQIPNVMQSPAPDVEILELNLNGPKLAVRPYCHTANYWQVYFQTNEMIRDLAVEKGYTTPAQHLVIHNAHVLSA